MLKHFIITLSLIPIGISSMNINNGMPRPYQATFYATPTYNPNTFGTFGKVGTIGAMAIMNARISSRYANGYIMNSAGLKRRLSVDEAHRLELEQLGIHCPDGNSPLDCTHIFNNDGTKTKTGVEPSDGPAIQYNTIPKTLPMIEGQGCASISPGLAQAMGATPVGSQQSPPISGTEYGSLQTRMLEAATERAKGCKPGSPQVVTLEKIRNMGWEDYVHETEQQKKAWKKEDDEYQKEQQYKRMKQAHEKYEATVREVNRRNAANPCIIL
jgi:hypothetical protein